MDGDKGHNAVNEAGTPATDNSGGSGREPWRERIDRVDWGALAPDRAAEIPDLLRDLADDGAARGASPVESLSTLHDILRFPEPGYLVAPTVVEFLVAIACDPATAPASRWRPLSLLLELVMPQATTWLPHHPDIALWRDEVAWVRSTSVEKARDKYETWLAAASTEQEYRRMAGRLATLEHDNGLDLIVAELETYDAARDRVTELAGLLAGPENRRSMDGAAEWACYVLAFFPEEAETLLAALTRESSLLVPKDLARSASDDPLSAELFAVGMLARPEHAAVTVGLAHQMASGHLYNSFTAAVALAVIHGERVPQECLRRISRSGRSRVGYTQLFGESWPHCGQRSPEQLGFLALGRGGEATQGIRREMLPGVLADAEDDSAAIVGGDALEMALGPRNASQREDYVESQNTGEFDHQTLEVLWTFAELAKDAWTEPLMDTLAAWGLPTDRDEFRAFTGVDEEAEDEPAEDEPGPGAAGPAAGSGTTSPGEGGGLLRRLLGG